MNDEQTLAKFNDIILKAQEVLNITPALDEEKKGNNLKELYLNATKNYLTGPEQIDQTFKNYYVFEKGEQAYNEEYQQILLKRAEIISKRFLQNFNENVVYAFSNLKSYTSLLVNFQNVEDYYLRLYNENFLSTNKLKNKNADIITKDRKSFYEDQGIQNLKFYYKIFFYIYIFLLLIFIISIFLVPSNISKIKQFIIWLILVFYLFIGDRTVSFVFWVGKKGLELLPKNVYKSI